MNYFIAASIGAFISVMIMCNGILSNAYGNYTASIIIHTIGIFAIIPILLIGKFKLYIQKDIPWYLYSGGAIGVFTVLFNNLSFRPLGVSLTLALGLLGQSVASIIIDHFGLLGMNVVTFEKKKFIGLFFVIIGIIVMTIF